MIEFPSMILENGEIFESKRIRELTEFFINKFSEEKLSYSEVEILLEHMKSVSKTFAIVQSLERK